MLHCLPVQLLLYQEYQIYTELKKKQQKMQRKVGEWA